MRIFLCIGTRPEAIKMLPLALEIRKHASLELKICHSGQHGKLADDVFDFFGIAADYRFNAMKKGQSLGELTRRLLNYFDVVFERERPHLVLVHGDTTSAFCASLAAFYRGISIAHVEAGLRTHNVRSPFPEEFNRVAIDSIADLHFAPTALARKNLENEGKKGAITVGNTVIDALSYTVRDDYSSPVMDWIDGKKLVLLTTHRRENLGERMHSALLGVRDALTEASELFCLAPLHPNPRIRELAEEVFHDVKNIKICDPLSVCDFHNALSRSVAVVTDSGGIQEEASYLGVPIFVLRDSTERYEALELGNARLVGTKREEVALKLLRALRNGEVLESMRKRSLVFGDGTACEKIVKKLLCLSENGGIIKMT